MAVINFKLNVTYGDWSAHDQDSNDSNIALFILWGIVLPLIATAGLLGNILTIMVLWRREMHSSTILYLRGLVVTDTGILIGTVITLTPISCANYLHGEALDYFRERVYPVIHGPGYYIIMTLQQCNVWITVSVSMERYIAICHPFRAADLITKTKTIIVMVAIVVISLIYNIPHLLAYTISLCDSGQLLHHPSVHNATVSYKDMAFHGSHISSTVTPPLTIITTNSLPLSSSPSSWQCLQVISSEFGDSEFYSTYRTIMYSIIIYIIPFLALLFLNSFLIKELMTMQRRRSGTNIHDENETNLSLVLVLIVIVFIFCQTPGLISQFDFLHVGAFLNWLAVSNLLFTTNSAVNFLIYTAFGRKFRRVLLRLFRHVIRKKRRQSHSNSRTTHNSNGDFKTVQLSSTNCSSLHRISRYRKMSKDKGDVGEDMPLRVLKVVTKETPNEFIHSSTCDNATTQAARSSLLQDQGITEENREAISLMPNVKYDVTL